MVLRASDEKYTDVCHSCITYLLERYHKEKSLFKISPDMTETHSLFQKLSKGQITRIKEDNSPNFIHVVLGCLLLGLRDMQISLLFEMYNDIAKLDASTLENTALFKEQVAQWLKRLPPLRFNLAKSLFELLRKIAAVTSTMDADESAVDFVSHVVSPYICRLPDYETSFMSIRHSRDLVTIRPVVSYVIQHQIDIFRDLHPLPAVSSAKSTPSVTRQQPNAKPALVGEASAKSVSGNFAADSNAIRIPSVPTLVSSASNESSAPSDYVSSSSSSSVGIHDMDMGVIDPFGGATPKNASINTKTWEWRVLKALVAFSVQKMLTSSSPSGDKSAPVTRSCSCLSDEGDEEPYAFGAGPSLSMNYDEDRNMKSPSANCSIRKQMVIECRKLRAQIYKFEEEWINLHDRIPKTAQERGAMQPIYVSYKLMKKEIRAMSATSIQKLMRGYLIRKHLRNGGLPNGNDVTDFNMEDEQRPATDRFFVESSKLKGDKVESNFKDLVLMDCSSGEMLDSMSMDISGSISSTSVPADRLQDPLAYSNTVDMSQRRGTSGKPLVNISTSADPGVTDLYFKYKDLMQAKRDLKKILKKFDEEFTAKNGRLPKKAEKEVMRPMYQKYHELKRDMDVIKANIEAKHGVLPVDEDDASGVESGREDNEGFSSSKRSVTAAPLKSLNLASLSVAEINELQEEKKKLHAFLKTYEKDFSKNNGRPVMKHEDISPVANEYQRYKDLKGLLKDSDK